MISRNSVVAERAGPMKGRMTKKCLFFHSLALQGWRDFRHFIGRHMVGQIEAPIAGQACQHGRFKIQHRGPCHG